MDHPMSEVMRNDCTGAMTMFCPTIPDSGMVSGAGVVGSGFGPPHAVSAAARSAVPWNRRGIAER
jgi:hypothetical protein